MSLPKAVLEELQDLEKQVANLPNGVDKTRMEAILLSIKSDLRGIYQMETKP